ncbi:conserved hypothetical protein [Cenarchaeum symbiosum A]|uniref:DNA repair protein n=1 Tax=Cenarchaeum symbiosum (strain A) TaxID=414004 RepID=A0RUQ6_CENSY|nr:conserved hypothetical protein [Cenarchaeum symbiosum A]
MEVRWNEYLSRNGSLFSSDELSGASPPSVFVGSYGYPRVGVGPMVPPVHGDTSLMDAPERWAGRPLDEIVNYRLSLVRGIRKTRVTGTSGRYIEGLQEAAMSRRPVDSDIRFEKPVSPAALADGCCAPFGPVGEIRRASFGGSSADGAIERAYYDRDLGAADAAVALYDGGTEISRIQGCLSVGMLGRRRKLVPTRWSITAVDDMVSKRLVGRIKDAPVSDAHQVFHYVHMGNLFSVVLFPHRWLFEMMEAYYSGGVLGFGADHEDARGLDHAPATAGAHFASRLAVAEHLCGRGVQAGALVLREIRAEYSVPVGVWQVREGLRAAMAQKPFVAGSLDEAIDEACRPMSISRNEWLSHGSIMRLVRQRTLSEFF